MDWNAILSVIIETAKTLGVKLLLSGIYVIIGFRLIKWLKKWLKTSKRLDMIEEGARSFLASVSAVLLYIVLFITVAVILGIPTTSFVAAIASVFAAIGLAMQGTLSNFAGGVMILIFKPFKVGDYIVAKCDDVEGTVIDVSLVYTVLRTFDNKEVTIPNGTLTNSVVVNVSTAETRRIDITVDVEFTADIEQVKQLLLDTASAHPKVLSDPAPSARLAEYGPSSLKFSVKAWCPNGDYWDVRFDLLEGIKKELDSRGIAIPFPQLDVHLPEEK